MRDCVMIFGSAGVRDVVLGIQTHNSVEKLKETRICPLL
jgi:hypothetical protein